MPEKPESIASYIGQLASPDAREREEAAHALFRVGCATAEPVLRSWFADPEFRALAPGGDSLLTIGIAVEPVNFGKIRSRLGQPRLAEAPSDQDVLEFELVFSHGVRLDILTTRDPVGNGAIARFLRHFGEGVQQVECEVRDVSRATAILRSRFAIEPLDPEPRQGADYTRVNFFFVPLPEGHKVLIELVEVLPSQKRPGSKPG